MANSLIDDMYSESNNWGKNNGKSNGKKTLLIMILFLLIIAVIIVAIILIGNKKQPKTNSGKSGFVTYFSQGISKEIINTDGLTNFFEKIKNDSSKTSSQIVISTNMEELEEIASYKAQIDTKYDSEKQKSFLDIKLDYLENNIFDAQALITSESFGIKSDEIVTKYVGYKYENLVNDVIAGVESSGFALSDVLEKFDYQAILNSMTPEFLQSELDRYIQIFNGIEDSKFSQKDITLKRENGDINATAYVLTLNQEELNNLFIAFFEEVKYDTELISIITKAFEPTGIEVTEQSVQELVDMLITSYSEVQMESDDIYTITVCANETGILKVMLENSIMSCDIDYIVDGNNASTVITVLDKTNESNSGVKIDFNNISNDVSEQFGIDISTIEANEVVSKISLNIKISEITSQTSMSVDTTFSYTDTTNEFTININTDIEFENVDIEDLTDENCLFLDALSEEERIMVMDSIEQRANEVLVEKQNQLNLIDSNTGSSVIQGKPDSEQDNDTKNKEKAQEKLINAVANEMYIAEQNGESYTVYDIEDLEIEDTELEITIENDIATIVIDGYTFMINAAFELSE